VPSYTVGFIDVYRNGALLGSADFTATNGTTVVLAAGASAGDLIETVSFYVSSVLNAIPATAGAVNSTYLLDGSVTQAKLASGVAGNGPAFSAWLSSNQTVSNTTFTKLQANTEEFDTASCYDNSTNYRFTPNVAGYYQVNGNINITSSNNTDVLCLIYKNGSSLKWGNYATRTSVNFDQGSVASALIYCNGTTDYLELFGYTAGTGTLQFIGSQQRTFFQASLVRSA
jgi:hypothetical protein